MLADITLNQGTLLTVLVVLAVIAVVIWIIKNI